MAATLSGPAETAVTGEARRAILDAARAPVHDTLRKPVRFKVEQLNVQGDWAFLYADMQDDQGRPIDFAGTSLAEAASHGALSKSYAVLLKRTDGRWIVVVKSIGPTDVVWADWSRQHGAPQTLFRN